MNEIRYPPGCKDIQVELTNEELIRRLKKISQVYQNLDQNATEKYKELSIYLGCDLFIQHEHDDVQLLVACCLADIFRIYAPESPFEDPTNLKNIFMFLANQLKGLKDSSNTSFKRYFYLLQNLECVKSFQLCLELEEGQDIVATLCENIFKIINDKTTAKVKELFYELLHPLINESDQISTRVIDTLFTRIIEPQKSNNKEAYSLAVMLLKKGNEHFEFVVQNHLNNILLTNRGNISHNLTLSTSHHQNASATSNKSSNDSDTSLNNSLTNLHPNDSSTAANQFISDKLCLIIYELNQIRYPLLELLMPQLEYKLKSSDLKERREYTKLLSKMFSEKESKLAHQLPQLWEAYLERFSDMNEDIRKICVQHICDFLIQQSIQMKATSSAAAAAVEATSKEAIHYMPENAPNVILDQIVEQIKTRSLDSEESLRFEVLQEILKAIKSDSNIINLDLLNILKERTLDIKIKVRKLALQGLGALYKKIHSKQYSRKTIQTVNWIPTKIMRIYFQDSLDDKQLVERLLNSSIVPYSLGAKEKMAQLYYAFSSFDEYSILSLIEIMKNRVLLNQLMKSIIDYVDSVAPSTNAIKLTSNGGSSSASTTTANKPISESKLNSDIMLISQNFLDPSKGVEFMKQLVELLKKNLNLRNYFKNFINVNCSCTKSMQLIQLIFTNINTMNQTQVGMAKRLIERMSSLIIDKECFEALIELVEYKVKQKLTLKQRRMLNKRKVVKTEPGKGKGKSKKVARGKKPAKKSNKNDSDSEESEEDDDEEDDEESDVNEELSDEDNLEELEQDEIDDEDEDDTSTRTTENTMINDGNDRYLVKHVDDDGEKGLKLISMILMIHPNYGFANPTTYDKLYSFINSRKDFVVSSSLKILSNYYFQSIKTFTKEQLEQFNETNEKNLAKLKHFCIHGKPKQAKHSIHLINNNFEKTRKEEILLELFKELVAEANLKQSKTFTTCLISLGHIAVLIPQPIAKEMKEFIFKLVVKEILLVPPTTPLNVSMNESTNTTASAKRKNNLKLAGKWCENEDELPFNTRVRIESIKLLVRWCLGLKGECPSIVNTLKMLVKMIKDNSADQKQKEQASNDTTTNKDALFVSEAEKSRIRAICGGQLIKMAQEPSFKQLITADFFHALAKLIIDPVTNIRDIIIKKLQKGLKSNKLSISYMGIFALCGFDASRERKSKVKKLYASLIKNIRLNDQQKQSKDAKVRVIPEMCLSFAVSLLAHNIKIDSLKDETKVKQIKECMSLILEPLLENPDSNQIAYIKNILNKIKVCDDGQAIASVQSASHAENATAKKAAIQNLYLLNRNLCFICEIFLFHLHSKSMYLSTSKESDFVVKLPAGFYAARENGSANGNEQQSMLNKEIEENLKDKSFHKIIGSSKENEEESDDEEENAIAVVVEEDSVTTKNASAEIAPDEIAQKPKSKSRIEIVAINRKRKANTESEKDLKKNDEEKENEEEEDDDDDNIALSKLSSKKSKDASAAESSKSLASPPNKRNKLAEAATSSSITSKDNKSSVIKDKNESKEIEDSEMQEEVEEEKTVGRRGRRAAAKTDKSATSAHSKAKKEDEKENEEEPAEEEKLSDAESDKDSKSTRSTRNSKKIVASAKQTVNKGDDKATKPKEKKNAAAIVAEIESTTEETDTSKQSSERSLRQKRSTRK